MSILVRLLPLVFCLSLLPTFYSSAEASSLLKIKKGKLACVVGHRFRNNGNELTFTGVRFRNFDPTATLTIEDIKIYSGAGVVLKDFVDLQPLLFNGEILGPNQTTGFDTIDVFGATDPGAGNRPVQIVVKWSSNERFSLELWGNVARTDRKRDKTDGSLGQRLARGLLRCARFR